MGSNSQIDRWLSCVSQGRLTSMPLSCRRWCWRYKQVIGKFVYQQASRKAYIGATALNDTRRGGCAADRPGIDSFDHRTQILEDDIATGALRQALNHLLANHLILIRGESFDLRIR